MFQSLQNWWLARKLNKQINRTDLLIGPIHASTIVRKKHSSEKLGSCTVTNFLDDRVSRDAAIDSINIKGQLSSSFWQQKLRSSAIDTILQSDAVPVSDNFTPTPTRLSTEHIIPYEGKNLYSPSLPNKDVHKKLKETK